MPLTDTAIRNTKPQTKPYKLTDGGGLFLLVQPTGSKWWRYKYHFAGKEKLISLGTYPDVSLADARERHAEARKARAAGNDPSQVKQAAKRAAVHNGENTFETVAREWHDNRKHMWSPKHAKQIMSRLDVYVFPKIGTRPIADVTAAELLAIARTIEARGAVKPPKTCPDWIGVG